MGDLLGESWIGSRTRKPIIVRELIQSLQVESRHFE